MTAPARRAASWRRFSVLFTLLVAAVGAAFAAAPEVRLARSARGETMLTIDVGPVAWREVGGAFVPVIDGFGSLGTTAAPDLPARRERIALEPGTELVLSSVDVEWNEGRLPGRLAPYPAADPGHAAIDAALAGFWPADVARVVVPEAAFRTLRFGEVLIAPLQVDLEAGTFRVARRIVLHVAAPAGTSMSAMAVRPALQRDALADALGDSLIHGASDVGRAAPPSSTGQALAPSSPSAAPTFPAWQFDVKTDGLYRITYAWAQANAPGLLTFLTSNPPAQYHLSVQNVDVPLEVSVANGTTFSPGDFIQFYGQASSNQALLDPSPGEWQGGRIVPFNVYRLDLAPSPPRIAAVPGARVPQSGYSVPVSFRTTAHREDDAFFQGFMPQDGLDHWLAGNILAGCIASTSCTDPIADANCGGSCGANNSCCASSLDQFVDTPGHAGGSVSYRARLHGYAYTNNFHRTELRVDGTLRDTEDWDGYVEFTQGQDQGPRSFTPGSPLAAQTKVTIRTQIGRSGATQDRLALNWVELDYDRLYQAASGRLPFTVPNDAGHEVHVDALSDVTDVWELTESTPSTSGMSIVQPRQVPAWTIPGGQVRFELDARSGLPSTRSFLAVSPSALLTPAAVRQDQPPSSTDASLGSSLKAAGNGADWIVIGERSLLNLNAGSQLNALVSLRKSSNGFRTAVIDVRDIYDEFGNGLEHPQAIRDFITYALANWTPAPSYAVLVGDTTFDYQNAYARAPRRQFVPSMMRDITANTQYGYYASDTWLTAVGGTALPSVMVGRVPAHTQAEAETIFQKIVSYEQAGPGAPSWAGRALLVSEREPDETEFDYINEHDTIYNRYFTTGPQTATKLYEGDPRTDCTAVPLQLKTQIQSATNAGAAILSFAGHGSYKAWGKGCASIFATEKSSPDDLDGVNTGSRLQFHVHANCITGAVTQDAPTSTTNDPWYTFLEAWMTRSGKGMVAGIAPSHLSYNFLLDATLDPVFNGVFGKHKERTVGVLDLRIRQNLASLNDTTGVESYILAGDPATRLAVPAPAAPTITSIDKAASGQLKVNWTAVPGVSTYRVYRSLSAQDYVLAGTSSGLSFVDTGLTNCTTYYYYVVAVDANGFESAWSNFNDTCYTNQSDCRSQSPENPSAPSAPTGLTLVDTQFGGQLRASWNANPENDVVRYTLAWGTTPGGPYPNTAVVGLPGYTIGGLADRVRTYAVVRAENCSKNGAFGAEASAVPHKVLGLNPPDAVGDLKVQRVPATSDLKLTWTVPTQTVWGIAATYGTIEIYGDQNSPAFPMDAAHKLKTLTSPAALNTWTHTGAFGGKNRWYYTVVAVDGGGLRGAPGDQLPDGVGLLTVTRVGTTQVQFNWPLLAADVNGKPLVIRDYNLYGQKTPFPRSSCTAANRTVAAITGTTYTQCMPGTAQPPLCDTTQKNFFWQLLGEDSHGAESVW